MKNEGTQLFETMKKSICNEPKNKRTNLSEVVPLEQPYVIMIDPIDICNFSCNFCPTNISKECLNKRHKQMSFEVFKKIVDDIKEFPDKIKAIDLYGFGEPLLNKELPQMIKYLKDSDVCNKIRISTNGALLTKEMCDELVESGLDYVKISVEALNEKGYLDICSAKIDWEKYKSNIKYLYGVSRGKLEIGVKIVSAALKNEGDMELFLETFSPISDYTFVEDLKNIWAEFEEIQTGDYALGDYYSSHVQGYSICTFPLTHMIVHSNGDIGTCCFDWKHATSYANINEVSLLEAWNSKKLYNFRMLHLEGKRNELGFCKNCEMKGYDNIDDSAQVIAKRLEAKMMSNGKKCPQFIL